MLIGGFQKMTMLDYPEKIACTVFTHGCNFKCPFCHNARLVTQAPQLIDEGEILSYLNKRKGILDGVCISGGEPLLQRDIFEFIKKIKDLGLLVKLDTNGYMPERLQYAIDSGLVDYVAMDIKNSKEKYALTSDCPDLDISKIEKSVEILKAGKTDYEFRTTVVKEYHNIEDMEKIGMWLKGAKKYYIQSFIDSGDIIGKELTSLDTAGLDGLLRAVLPYIPEASLRGI